MKKRKLALFLASLVAIAAIPFAAKIWVKRRTFEHAKTCMENLSWIGGAIQQWAVDHGKRRDDPVTWEDLVRKDGTGYLKEIPVCPEIGANDSYTITKVGEEPECKAPIGGHELWAVSISVAMNEDGTYADSTNEMNAKTCRSELTHIQRAIEAWAADNGKLPGDRVTWNDLVNGHYLQKIPRCDVVAHFHNLIGIRYKISSVGKAPVCTSGLKGHSLPDPIPGPSLRYISIGAFCVAAPILLIGSVFLFGRRNRPAVEIQ